MFHIGVFAVSFRTDLAKRIKQSSLLYNKNTVVQRPTFSALMDTSLLYKRYASTIIMQTPSHKRVGRMTAALLLLENFEGNGTGQFHKWAE